MDEKKLFTIAITIALIGILSLLFISERLEPTSLKINEITKEHINKQIKVNGTVESIKETPGLYIITIKDESDKIPVVIFKQDEELNITKDQKIEVMGKVEEYNGMLEVIADIITVI